MNLLINLSFISLVMMMNFLVSIRRKSNIKEKYELLAAYFSFFESILKVILVFILARPAYSHFFQMNEGDYKSGFFVLTLAVIPFLLFSIYHIFIRETRDIVNITYSKSTKGGYIVPTNYQKK